MPAPTVRVLDYTGADMGASPSITVEEGNPVVVALAHRVYASIREASYRWTASGVTDTYYLEAAAGGDPGITWGTNPIAYYQGVKCVEGSATDSLTDLECKVGDSNTLGFDTMYVRVPAGWGDPDSLPVGALYFAKDNPSFSWGDGDVATWARIWWTTPAGETIDGYVCGFPAVASGTLVCRVENESGLTGTLNITVTVNASTRTVKTAGVDDTLTNLLTTYAATDDIEIVVPSGTHPLATHTLSGDNVVIRLESGAVVTITGSQNLTGERFSIIGPSDANATFTASGEITLFTSTGATAAAPATRWLFKDFTYGGDVSSLFQVDRHGAGFAIDNVRAGDLSATSGQRSYFLYGTNRADNSLDGRPHQLLMIRGCANDYGVRDEAVIRTGGDLVNIVDCTFEQTNVTTTDRAKGMVRVVGGDSWSVIGNTLSIPEDTTGKSLNSSQGVSGISNSPSGSSWDNLTTHNGSWGTWGHHYEQNKLRGCSIQCGSGLNLTVACKHEKIVIRSNIIEWAWPKHEGCFAIGAPSTVGSTVTLADYRILHNTFTGTQALSWRFIDYTGFTGTKITGLYIENNLCVNSLCALANNATTCSLFGVIRSADHGVTEIAAFNANVWAVPDESAAGGNFPAGSFACVDAATGSTSIGAASSAATINGYANSSADNTRESVTLDGSYVISGSPSAATGVATRSAGVLYDYYGNAIPASGGAVGATGGVVSATSLVIATTSAGVFFIPLGA